MDTLSLIIPLVKSISLFFEAYLFIDFEYNSMFDIPFCFASSFIFSSTNTI